MLNGCNHIKNTEQPLISVIVPVYKVEQYLHKCVDSILNQTYKNLEIIIVDDGSPDRCPEICNAYGRLDERIRVIHKPNGGLSSARNAALEIANGEYLQFIDSDDSIEPDMIMYLFQALQRTGSQIAMCGFIKKFEDGRTEIENSHTEETIYDADHLLNVFLRDEQIGSQPCNKLFAKKLFYGITFPEGRIYEDIAMMHKIFASAERAVCLPEGKYNYLIHGESTSFTKNARWAFGLYRAFADRYEYINNIKQNRMIEKDVEDLCLSKACGFAIAGFNIWNNKQDKEYMDNATGFLKKYKKNILKNSRITKKRKIKATMLIYCQKIYLALEKKG